MGNSVEAQGLGLTAFTAVACVQTLTGELRFHKLYGVAKKKKVFYSIQNCGTTTSNSLPPNVPCCGYMSSFLVGDCFGYLSFFLHFHTNCEIIFSSSVKNSVGSLIGIALNL